jgi:hypothetical protein
MYRKHVKAEDQLLLDTVFAREPTQEMLDKCLGICDIEAMGTYKSLMFSYLMQDHPELRFSDYAGPRIKGLIHFYRFDNIRVLSHFSRIGKALNEAGIPMLLFKGAAIKALRPELARPMADVDFLVPAEYFSKTLDVCKKLGYRKESSAKNSGDVLAPDGRSAVDVHNRVFKFLEGAEPFHAALISRARRCTVFGVQLLMPVREDLFTIVLLNLEKNLREESSLHSLYFSLFDIRFLLSGTFNWNIVRKNAQITNSAYPIRLAAAFMNTLASGIIPTEKLEKYFPWTLQMERKWERKMVKVQNRSALERVIDKRAEACREIMLVELKRHPRQIFARILKLFLLRKLRDFPVFVRWYLESRGYEVYRAD